jgi:DNA-binding protein HU-beta
MRSAPKTLTKAEIIVQLAEKNALTKKQSTAFLESFVELAYRETKKNKKFAITGLGILKLNKRAARLGRNPATGAQIKIPAKTVVKLTVSKACKDAILGQPRLSSGPGAPSGSLIERGLRHAHRWNHRAGRETLIRSHTTSARPRRFLPPLRENIDPFRICPGRPGGCNRSFLDCPRTWDG